MCLRYENPINSDCRFGSDEINGIQDSRSILIDISRANPLYSVLCSVSVALCDRVVVVRLLVIHSTLADD